MSGPRHVVTWPRAAFLVDGEHIVVERGGDVPDGVDERTLTDLRVNGAIALGGPVADASLPEVAAGSAPGGLPLKGAPRPEWDLAATALGIDPADYKKKPELVEAVTAAHGARFAEAAAVGAPAEPDAGDGDEPDAGDGNEGGSDSEDA